MASKFSPSVVIFIITSCLFTIVSFSLVSYIAATDLIRFDVRAFYTGAVMAAHNVTTGFYDPTVQYTWQKQFFAIPDQTYLLPFVYPSFVALPISVIASLPIELFYKVVAIADIFLLLWTFFILLRTLKLFSDPVQTGIACLLFFSFLPLWESVMQIQLTPILFFAFIVAWAAQKKHHNFLAGVALSLLLVRPHLIIVPVIVLIYKQQWRTLAGIGAGGIILLFLFAWTTGIASVFTYLHVLLNYQSLAGMYDQPHLEATLKGFLHAITHTRDLGHILPAYIFLSGGILILLLRSLKGTINTTKPSFDIQWSLIIVTTILTSPHTLFHDVLLLMLPILILVQRLVGYLSKRSVMQWKLWCVIYGVFFFELLSGIFRSYPVMLVPLILSIFGLLMWQLRQEQARQSLHAV